MSTSRGLFAVLGLSLALGGFVSSAATAEPVRVRFPEGAVRGFLSLRSLDGTLLADGDLTQTAQGDRVTCRVVFRFRDGSLHDETVVFSQSGDFALRKDHLIQNGPSFPHPIDLSVDAEERRVTGRYRDGGGREKVVDERPKMPGDISNGLMFTLLKNISPDAPKTTFSMVAATPRPRLVTLVVTPAGNEAFTVGRSKYESTQFDVRVEGLVGFIARLIGRKSPTTRVWILRGTPPTFVKAEGALYVGGPVWRIELASPAPPPAAAMR